ncbi:hypothetical protein POTOM_047476 [Populus tomentosa]|uniref:Uncharacterized protein n=1 Tax=Populus tomentosa TaxID=118781 RepID=A0A8X7YFL8_POPTO|nr:hypothetical protein POTOM_047476 [Populus tomentosa]
MNGTWLPAIPITKAPLDLGGGVAESTNGFATTTAASLVRVKDDSGVVNWKTANLTEPKAKKKEKGNDQNALKRPPITFFLLMLQRKVEKKPYVDKAAELKAGHDENKNVSSEYVLNLLI